MRKTKKGAQEPPSPGTAETMDPMTKASPPAAASSQRSTGRDRGAAHQTTGSPTRAHPSFLGRSTRSIAIAHHRCVANSLRNGSRRVRRTGVRASLPQAVRSVPPVSYVARPADRADWLATVLQAAHRPAIVRCEIEIENPRSRLSCSRRAVSSVVLSSQRRSQLSHWRWACSASGPTWYSSRPSGPWL